MRPSVFVSVAFSIKLNNYLPLQVAFLGGDLFVFPTDEGLPTIFSLCSMMKQSMCFSFDINDNNIHTVGMQEKKSSKVALAMRNWRTRQQPPVSQEALAAKTGPISSHNSTRRAGRRQLELDRVIDLASVIGEDPRSLVLTQLSYASPAAADLLSWEENSLQPLAYPDRMATRLKRLPPDVRSAITDLIDVLDK